MADENSSPKAVVVPIHKYAKANAEFVSRHHAAINETVTSYFTKATDQAVGAITIVFGRDSVMPVVIGKLGDADDLDTLEYFVSVATMAYRNADSYRLGEQPN